MIEETEARKRILEKVGVTERRERVSLGEASGRVLAGSMVGQIDLPGFDNSSMDGYAVRAAEAADGASLLVQDEQPAGEDRQLVLAPGSAIRIFTGAPMPREADSVVMQEDVQRSSEGDSIRVVEGVHSGENVRPRGGDVCRGQRLCDAGSLLTPPAMGLLASQGLAEVEVRPRPRVAILTTGDELVPAGSIPAEQLAPGHLFNSNGPMLAGMVEEVGGIPLLYHAPDDPLVLRETVERALAESDFLLIAGGVSVGERDYVKAVLQEAGVEMDFWRVRLKPGKPFLFGTHAADSGSPSFVFGLPGNPVSAFVTFHVFAAPALASWQGRPGFEEGNRLALESFEARLLVDVSNTGDRPHYLRMRWDAKEGGLKPTGLQQSHALFGLSRADALLRLDAKRECSAGEIVSAWRL